MIEAGNTSKYAGNSRFGEPVYTWARVWKTRAIGEEVGDKAMGSHVVSWYAKTFLKIQTLAKTLN